VPHRLFGFSTMTISWEILVSQNALHLGQRWEMMRVASIQFYKISDDVQVLAPHLAHGFCMKLARGATLKPSAWSGMEWRWRPCISCTINHLKSQVKYFLSSLHFFVWIILNRFLENPFFFGRFARVSLTRITEQNPLHTTHYNNIITVFHICLKENDDSRSLCVAAYKDVQSGHDIVISCLAFFSS
jgi:hypothetical protein